MTQLLDKDIKTVIETVFHMLKKIKFEKVKEKPRRHKKDTK